MGLPLRVGIIGVGNISTQYLAHIPTLPTLKLIALADLDMARAAEVAAKAGVESRSVDELLASKDIDVILNLTTPGAHAVIAMKALTAGKHVFGEKPLALTVEEAKPMMELAKSSGLRIGSAPDTVLGTGIQTSRDLLDSGKIGKPLAASAFWSAPGHELWHPAPQFYYLPGAGPLFDMGPYYLTALVTLLGPVVSVIGSSTRSDRKRTVETGELAGTELRVEVETHISALLEHASGVTSTIIMSFEVWAARLPRIEVYGTEGTISVPDPNMFSDEVQIYTSENREWKVAPASAGYMDAGRGFGLADMAIAIDKNQPHRASGDLAFHVLEIMESILKSAKGDQRITMKSTVAQPEKVPFSSLT